jgi:hypothetical protein
MPEEEGHTVASGVVVFFKPSLTSAFIESKNRYMLGLPATVQNFERGISYQT